MLKYYCENWLLLRSPYSKGDFFCHFTGKSGLRVEVLHKDFL